METKKFKIQVKEKGGKDNTKSVFSKAGFTFVGAVAGAAFSSAGKRKEQEHQEEIVADENVVETEQEILAENNTQESVSGPLASEETISEPQPIDESIPSDENTIVSEAADDIDPNLIAQAIASEVDPGDIDSESVLTIDGFDYAYLPDGSRQMVAIAHTPDGTQYVVADLDGDGVYGDIYDIEGNYVAEVEGLSMSDLFEMADNTGGYIAGMEEPWEDGSIADATADVEEVNEDELYAQLTSDEEPTEVSILDRIFGGDSENEEQEEEEIEGENDGSEEPESDIDMGEDL